MRARVQRLRAEVTSDRRALIRHLDNLASVELGPGAAAGSLAQAAVALHHAYTAVETMLVRVARLLEGEAPTGPDWHKELVEAMGLELEDVRPAVLSLESVKRLRVLLGFRHFFRHAYTVDLERERLDELRREALALRPSLEHDLDGLDSFLRDLAAAADG